MFSGKVTGAQELGDPNPTGAGHTLGSPGGTCPHASPGDPQGPSLVLCLGTPSPLWAQLACLTRTRKPSGQVNWSYQRALYMIRRQPMSAMTKASMRAGGICR